MQAAQNSRRPIVAILADWALNPAQQALLQTEAQSSVYVGGVGGVGVGKTTADA